MNGKHIGTGAIGVPQKNLPALEGKLAELKVEYKRIALWLAEDDVIKMRIYGTDKHILENVSIKLEMEKPLVFDDARRLRGFFGHEYRNRPEFHHHLPNGLVYQHPLIQYKVLNGAGWITGLKEGAFILLAMKLPSEVYIHHQHIRIIDHQFIRDRIAFGITEKPIQYRFVTPWLPLNSENYREFQTIQREQSKVDALLCKILIGNLLSLSKAVNYVVPDRLQVSLKLELAGEFTIKPGHQNQGLKMLGFEGEFEVNFALPSIWGIGKSAARGFGTAIKKEEVF